MKIIQILVAAETLLGLDDVGNIWIEKYDKDRQPYWLLYLPDSRDRTLT